MSALRLIATECCTAVVGAPGQQRKTINGSVCRRRACTQGTDHAMQWPNKSRTKTDRRNLDTGLGERAPPGRPAVRSLGARCQYEKVSPGRCGVLFGKTRR
jgi:hypothetical protein